VPLITRALVHVLVVRDEAGEGACANIARAGKTLTKDITSRIAPDKIQGSLVRN
jgi:hypothetical protein